MSSLRADEDGLPTLTWTGREDTIEHAVREAQLLILTWPAAAQSLYRAFVAEGRTHARTPEGQARRAQLAQSPLLARVRAVWEPATFNLLEADGDGVLPSTFVEALLMSLDAEGLDRLLAELAAPAQGGARGR